MTGTSVLCQTLFSHVLRRKTSSMSFVRAVSRAKNFQSRQKRFFQYASAASSEDKEIYMSAGLFLVASGATGIVAAGSNNVTIAETTKWGEDKSKAEADMEYVLMFMDDSPHGLFWGMENFADQMESLQSWTARVKRIFCQELINRTTNWVSDILDGLFVGNAKDEWTHDNRGDDTATMHPPPQFPSLSVHLINSQGTLDEFQLNSRAAIPVETDLFVGKMTLVIAPSKEQVETHPCYRDDFLSDNIRFHLQLQGRFKREPNGEIYCGAEITEKPTINPVSKGLCTVLLQLLLRTIGGGMHYSFGSHKQRELPHIVFPVATAMDHVIVTKMGDAPPSLGKPFKNDAVPTSKALTEPQKDWNVDNTYSMTFSSAGVDLATWRMANICSIPLVPDFVNLEYFWGKSLLRLVIYEKSGEQDKHLLDENNYLMTLQVENIRR